MFLTENHLVGSGFNFNWWFCLPSICLATKLDDHLSVRKLTIFVKMRNVHCLLKKNAYTPIRTYKRKLQCRGSVINFSFVYGLSCLFSNDSWNYIHRRSHTFESQILGPRTGWPRFAKKPSSTLLPLLLSFGTAFTPGYWTFPQRNVDFFFHYRSPVPFRHANSKTAPYFVHRSDETKKLKTRLIYSLEINFRLCLLLPFCKYIKLYLQCPICIAHLWETWC